MSRVIGPVARNVGKQSRVSGLLGGVIGTLLIK